MLFLEPVGWLDGLTSTTIVLISGFFGVYSFYKAVKLNAKLLQVTGICIFSIGFVLLGPTVDFFVVLFTGNNMEPFWLYGLLSYSWTAPITISGLYIGGELLAPNRKKLIVTIYGILSVIFEVILFYFSFTDPLVIFVYPNPPPMGAGLLNTSMVLASITFILMLVFLISGLIFNGFGFLRKSFQASGVIKRNFRLLSLSWILFTICGALDGVFDPGVLTFFTRIGMTFSVILMYLGVRMK